MSKVESTEGAVPSASSGKPPRTPGDLLLFLEALVLTGKAQRISRETLDRVGPAIRGTWLPYRSSNPERAAAAARRAGVRAARRAGWLDTCLTRSLVVAGLLKDRHRIILSIGFRQGKTRTADGHAWLVVDGRRFEVSAPPPPGELAYTEILKITL